MVTTRAIKVTPARISLSSRLVCFQAILLLLNLPDKNKCYFKPTTVRISSLFAHCEISHSLLLVAVAVVPYLLVGASCQAMNHDQ